MEAKTSVRASRAEHSDTAIALPAAVDKAVHSVPTNQWATGARPVD